MTWNSIDAVLFAGHLSDVLAGIEAALEALGYQRLVIAAGLPHPLFQDDQSHPFRASPWFTWLVPAVSAAGSVLVLEPGRRPRLLFAAPEDYWHSAPQLPEAAWVVLFDITLHAAEQLPVSAFQDFAAGRTAWLGEAIPPVAEWEQNPARLIAQLQQLRCLKDAYEIACLREATRIGVAGHLAAERAFRGGASEFEVLLAFLGAAKQTEGELPYPPIVALNDHAATLHYQRREVRAPGRRLSLLIDAGASCRGYGSDITRTWSSSPGLFGSLIDGMHGLQQELCAAVKPGVDWRELHLQAHRLVARLLRDAGVLRMEPEDALQSGVSAAFLPHGLGHLLGLQVHDVGGFQPAADAAPIDRPPGHPALRLTRVLAPGMVVTVEPGLYFIHSLLAELRAGPHAKAVNWPLVERLAMYGGIRIEDNVVVTATGHDNLTRTAFADVG